MFGAKKYSVVLFIYILVFTNQQIASNKYLHQKVMCFHISRSQAFTIFKHSVKLEICAFKWNDPNFGSIYHYSIFWIIFIIFLKKYVLLLIRLKDSCSYFFNQNIVNGFFFKDLQKTKNINIDTGWIGYNNWSLEETKAWAMLASWLVRNVYILHDVLHSCLSLKLFWMFRHVKVNLCFSLTLMMFSSAYWLRSLPCFVASWSL